MAGEQFEQVVLSVDEQPVGMAPYRVAAPTAMAPTSFLPLLSVEDMVKTYEVMKEFIKKVMKPGEDYDTVTNNPDEKPSLMQPGAEKLNKLWGHSVVMEIHEQTIDWNTMLFEYVIRCTLARDGVIVAQKFGSCSSYESRYRYRNLERMCPICEQPAIKVSKFPPRDAPDGTPPGFYCYAKVGGCGANFNHDDTRITQQKVGRETNPDMADVKNTVLQIAQKRALVNATKTGCMASEFFTAKSGDWGGDTEDSEDDVRPQRNNQSRPPQQQGQRQQQRAPQEQRPQQAGPGFATSAQMGAINDLAKKVYGDDAETILAEMLDGTKLENLTVEQAKVYIEKLKKELLGEAAPAAAPAPAAAEAAPAPAPKVGGPTTLNAEQIAFILNLGKKLWGGSAVGEIRKVTPPDPDATDGSTKTLHQMNVAEGKVLMDYLKGLVKENPNGIKLETKTRKQEREEAAAAAPEPAPAPETPPPPGNYKPVIKAQVYPAFLGYCADQGWGGGVAQHILNAAKVEGFFEAEINDDNMDRFEAAVKQHFDKPAAPGTAEEVDDEDDGLTDDEIEAAMQDKMLNPNA